MIKKYFYEGVPFYVLFSLLTLFPVLILSFYNHPSVDDDFCFAYMTRDYGFFESQKLYYQGWSGRYFANMLFHATPLAFGYFGFVKWMPFVIMILLGHSFYCLCNEFLNLTIKYSFLLSILFLSVLVGFSLSSVDLLFWYTSVFIYPIAIVMWAYFTVFLNRFYLQTDNIFFQFLKGVFLVMLVFFMIGTNELLMIFTILFLGFLWLCRLIYKGVFDFFLFFLTVFALLSAYFLVVKAPGTIIRTGGGDIHFDFFLLLRQSFFSFFLFSKQWLLHTPVLLFSLFFIFKAVRNNIFYHHVIFKINPILTFLACISFIIAMFFVIHYGSGESIPGRVTNMIFGFYLIFLFFHTVVISNWVVEKQFKFQISILPTLILFATILFMWSKAQNIKWMYKDIIKGTAKSYDLEMTARYQEIKNSPATTILLGSIKNKPMSIFIEDIGSNEKHLWNKCYAQYFKKQGVKIK